MITSNYSYFVLLSLGILIASSAERLCAAEGTWRDRLPFGSSEQQQPQQPAPQGDLLLGDPTLPQQPVNPQGEKGGWMVDSPLAKVSWPEVKMPQFQFNPPWRAAPGEESWFSRQANRARSGARNAVDNTRTAWNNTVEKMKIAMPGGNNGATQVASQDQKPSFWQRLLGPSAEQQPDGGGEMIAQEPGEFQKR